MISRKTDLTIEARLRVAYSAPEPPHEALVNLRDEPEAMEAFIKRFEFSGPVRYRPMTGGGLLRAVRDFLRKAWSGDKAAMRWAQDRLDGEHFNLVFERKRMIVEPKSLMGTLCLLVLRDYYAGKTAICANPDCHSPYFLKKRKTQKYCESGPCTAQAQREQKRLWWERNYGKGAK